MEPITPAEVIADSPLTAVPPIGRTDTGVTILPDTVPDQVPREYQPRTVRVSRYYKCNVPGVGRIKSMLKRLDLDLKEAIVDQRGRSPTIGELMIVQSLLLCEQKILLINQWFKKNKDNLEGSIAKAEEQRRVSMERDRHFKELGLGEAAPASVVEMLYGKLVSQ